MDTSHILFYNNLRINNLQKIACGIWSRRFYIYLYKSDI